ncbi:MAG: renalase [Halioglobus sp.]|jgi:predicted NAD/FAD-dependent oxidoreductase
MTATTQNTDIVIIGAGLAGLSAASELKKLGVDVLIVDKGRGLGGRLAGRRIGDASFDHGAQFMTTRHPKFVEQVRQWMAAGVAQEWYSSFPGQANSHARYRGVPTMTAIAKHLAIGLNVQLSTKVESIGISDGGWVTHLDNGHSITSGSLIITSPVPQTLDLLSCGNIQLSPYNASRLTRIQYESCIAVMATLDQPSIIQPPGALVIDSGPIAWISDNQQKGVSSIPAVTIHGSGDYSAKHFDEDRDEVAKQLIKAATPYLGAAVIEYQVHGWRYSKPVVVDDRPCMLASESTDLPPLVLAGDAFAGPRVEGAVLSGWAAADCIAQARLAASTD